MPIQAKAPTPEQENPYQPPGPPEPLVMQDFMGIDTASSRLGVDQKQMRWCDSWMPLGAKNLRTMFGIGPILYTPAEAIIFFGFANIGALPVAIVFLADGSIDQVATTTGSVVQIAPPGTILNPSTLTSGMTQYGSQYVIIVAQQENGYFIWDGTFLYGSGSLAPPVILTNPGVGYLSPPTVTAFGGSGSGATFVATVNSGFVTGVSMTNPGAGYGAYDYVGLAFSGGGISARTAILTAVVSNGTLSTVNITDAGSGYTADATAAVFGGGGVNGSVSIGVTSGTVSSASVGVVGSGYASTPTIIVTDSNNPVARAEVLLTPLGISGNAAETYSGRVWVVNGPSVFFTGPGSVTDFSTSSGGGNFQSSDSFLRSRFVRPIQTNGFLYLVADSSINYISGVQVNGTPPTTTFTNQNADPEVGTPWPSTVTVFGRNIVFANSFGAHVSYGAAVTKISEPLDGIYNSVPNFGGFIPSAAKAEIFGKKVWMILLPIIDPISGEQVNKLMMWNGKFWWAATQNADLTFIQHQEIDSVLTAWGTDGVSIFPLFQVATDEIEKVVQSKYWETPGGYQFIKSTARLWSIFSFTSDEPINVEIDVENENPTQSATYFFESPQNTIPVINASSVTIPTINGLGATIPVISVASGYFVTKPTAVAQNGAVVGLTVRTSEPDVSLLSVMVNEQLTQYRG